MSGPLTTRSGGLRHCLALGLPALAGKQHRSWHLVLSAHVIGDLSTRHAERFGRLCKTQSMLPTPTDEVRRVGMSVLSQYRRRYPGKYLSPASPLLPQTLRPLSCHPESRVSRASISAAAARSWPLRPRCSQLGRGPMESRKQTFAVDSRIALYDTTVSTDAGRAQVREYYVL